MLKYPKFNFKLIKLITYHNQIKKVISHSELLGAVHGVPHAISLPPETFFLSLKTKGKKRQTKTKNKGKEIPNPVFPKSQQRPADSLSHPTRSNRRPLPFRRGGAPVDSLVAPAPRSSRLSARRRARVSCRDRSRSRSGSGAGRGLVA
jgi:hypothetical protein